MKDYFKFGWRACGAGLVFQFLTLVCLYTINIGIAASPDGAGYTFLIGAVIFLVVTLLAFGCRPIYEKGLDTRFPNTNLSKKVFFFTLIMISLLLCIVYALFFTFITYEVVNTVSDIESAYYNAALLPFLMVGIFGFTFFYFLLYCTATVEYIWRRKLKKYRERLMGLEV